ncbi:MAG: hypothetical protein C4523_01495 [Myxococcales bacterium]|nr:MAG: hypothetical protein C4523_01495 [Myxococcales bacterium]
MSTLFDPAVLHEIAQKGIGLPYDTMFQTVIAELDRRYPGRIRVQQRWIFNNACGAMGQLTLLYGSLTEYLILFGTPIGTEGHSGRYSADVHDFMIDGEMLTYREGEFVPTVFKPGDRALLERGASKGYCVRDHAWMLEYSKGWIPFMLPTGLADNFFSNLDFRSVFTLMWDYGKLCVRELLRGKF